MEQKRLPIGIDDFGVVASECYYVDKTGFIEEVCAYPTGTACLYTRPRRFGKSLALSMLDYFFSQKRSSASLFADKEVAKDKDLVAANLNKHPLIHLDLKNTNASSYADLLFRMQDTMGSLYESFPETRDVSEYSRRYYDKSILRRLSASELSSSLANLIAWINQATGKKAMVLIDEYDAPIQNAFEMKFYDEAVLFFKDFFGMALKGNDNLGKAILTGVTQIGQASIFSGMNNLVVNSILSLNHHEFFGFVEEETGRLLSAYSLADQLEGVKAYYGGYVFQKQAVFNPWSVINFVQNGGVYKNYWFNTSSSSPLKIMLGETGDYNGTALLTSLMNRDHLVSSLSGSVNFLDLKSDEALLSLLVYSGYLVPEGTSEPFAYTFRFPNQEVAKSFRDEVFTRYVPSQKVPFAYALRTAIAKGNSQGIEDSLTSFLLRGFSYFDFKDERNYQILVLTLSAILFDDSFVRSEVNSGTGRADVLVIPKRKNECGIIFELKVVTAKTSHARMLSSASSALKQIEKKDYAEILRSAGAQPLIAYGLCFNSKQVAVKSKKLI